MLIRIGRRFEISFEGGGIFIALPWTKGSRWTAFLDQTGQGLSVRSLEPAGTF